MSVKEKLQKYGVIKKVIVPETHEEHPDSTPLALPIGFRRPETLQEQIARLVNREYSNRKHMGYESLEEADDFGDDEGDDDLLPETPYEKDHDIATMRSIDMGLTKAPDYKEGKEAQERVSKWKREKESKKEGKSQSSSEEHSGAPHNSEE